MNTKLNTKNYRLLKMSSKKCEKSENCEKIEKDYNSCIDYLITNVQQATNQMKYDRINDGFINIDLKLSQCESFINKEEYMPNYFGIREIHRNNICYVLQPLEYVQYKFPDYKITPYTNSNELFIQKVFNDFKNQYTITRNEFRRNYR
jgi:hypothetical protein